MTLYGALLRLDAFTGKYGPLDHPAWARFATHVVAPLAAHIRPSIVHWPLDRAPYVGGDPITYLRFAREMTTFYQPHVREPVFLALIRGALVLLDQQDAAVSLASAVGSVLMIVATFLLGRELVSPIAGLLAAALVAVEYELIGWSVDGWRDDVFAAAVVFAAWGLLRLHRRPSFSNGLLAGVTAGIACLTRITALSFVVPGLAWVAFAGGRSFRRERATSTAIAATIATALVGPFLLSCAIATGDPFYAIDYHTSYYRAAEGSTTTHPERAAAYLRERFAARPVNMIDTGTTGVFVRPFVTKWSGFHVWLPRLGGVLSWLSVFGLAALPFFTAGRLLLLILFTSLVPYAFTWNVGDGGAWRFTMHAYPFYLVAAAFALVGPWSGVATWIAAPRSVRRTSARRAVMQGLSVAAVVGAGAAIHAVLPWYDVREDLEHGASVSVAAGPRDGLFFRSGWSPVHLAGAIPVRVSRTGRATVFFPLPSRRPCTAVLRIDPVDPAAQHTVSVLFNSQLVDTLHPVWDPSRVGSYEVPLPPAWMKSGVNALTLVPDAMVPARLAGPRFGWIEPSADIGVRLWQVRLVPQER
ncbi:MAG: glycosyltransferase family 39 protein [Vicinamibacterales bacterium]